MFALGGEEVSPGDHLGVLLQQSATLALGHATPDTELDAVVEGVGATLLDHRAVAADHGRLALCGAANEEFIGIGLAAPCLRDPRDASFRFRALYYCVDWGTSYGPARRGPSS
jgi:hypothetical protein